MRRFVIVVFSALVAAAALEAALSVFFYFHDPSRCDHVWVFEESQRTIHFDPVLGYRLTRTPSRYARITYGEVEYIGLKLGNNQGFPDRDDFSTERSGNGGRRFAVFGDSFTAASYIDVNWPDRVEDIQGGGGRATELLNFSSDGAGLANWWSVLLRHIETRGYKLDGIIFAVFGDDLRRTFTIADHTGPRRHLLARTPEWDPATYPDTIEEARVHLTALNGFIVSKEEFDLALEGKWCPPRELKLYMTPIVRSFSIDLWNWPRRRAPAVRRLLGLKAQPVLREPQRRLIQDIRRYTDEHGLPVLVVSVPGREQLLQHGASSGAPADTREFAELLGADLLDGSSAFAGLSGDEIRAQWLPYDGHWAQPGSDQFAEFMARTLETWP